MADAIDPEKALIPTVQRVNEMRVKKGFWPKLRSTASRIPFAGQALAAWYATQDPKTPIAAKGVEDTAFYRRAPLLSANEVGSAPEQCGSAWSGSSAPHRLASGASPAGS